MASERFYPKPLADQPETAPPLNPTPFSDLALVQTGFILAKMQPMFNLA
jgi:hypothetical protein